MFKRIVSISLAIIMSAVFAGCTANTPSVQETDVPGGNDSPAADASYLNATGSMLPISLYGNADFKLEGEYSADYTAANNAFTVKMLKAMEEGQTCVFSPLSLQIALQVLANGGDEAAANALLESICPGLTRADVNVSAARLIESLIKSEGVSINTAVVANSAYRICTDFANTAANYYHSSVGAIDFSDADDALEKINGWISDNTGGLVKELVDRVGPDTAVVILNALTLKLDWAKPFNALRGLNEFRGVNGTVSVPMIKAVNEYEYGDFEEGSMAVIPYAGGEYAMAVMLPAEGFSPSEAASALIGRLGECAPALVSVTMPKVELSSKHDVLSMADKLGIEESVRGNFARMLDDESANVTQIVQGAALQVTEFGTTATAATAIVATKGVSPTKGEYELVCDRPYAMVIYQVETGAVMFAALVSDVG